MADDWKEDLSHEFNPKVLLTEEEKEKFGPNTSDPGKALRYNKGKVQFSHMLDFPRAMSLLCQIAEYGANKYDRGNFQKGQKASVTIDSMMRHLMYWWIMQDDDTESALHHLGHFVWNAVVLTEDMIANRNGDNNRTFSREDLTPPNIEDVLVPYLNRKKVLETMEKVD